MILYVFGEAAYDDGLLAYELNFEAYRTIEEATEAERNYAAKNGYTLQTQGQWVLLTGQRSSVLAVSELELK